MSEDNGPGPEVAITVNAGEGAAGEGGDGGQVVETPAVEAAAEAVVAVAEIEANRDVALAVIHQEGEAEFADRLHSEELEQCRTTIARLEGELEALRNPPVVEAVLLTPEQSLEPPLSPPEAPSESAAEGGQRESPVELAEAPPVEEPPKPKKPFIRWT